MSEYKAPIEEILFSMFNVNGYAEHYASSGLDKDFLQSILTEAGKFAENELFPLNASGDKEGASLVDGAVKSPTGFKEAYQTYVEGGWPSLAQPEAFGGQNLPVSLSLTVNEIWQSSNQAWCMYSVLGEGTCETMQVYGTDEQKQLYLPKLVSGEWTGTMCLTESQAGSDLGLLRTKAEPTADGNYKITGSKIFISSGDHDLAENIVHLVLARLPGAPEGTRGISLFIVPKFKVNSDGTLGELNSVSCGSIEHKMGLKGSATCVMNFDGAEGFLIGPENKGLGCMFTFINKSRLGVAMQGISHAEGAYQTSKAYANERLQGKSLNPNKQTDQAADPLTVQPDIRRMLLTQKAFVEAGRTLVHECAKLVDLTHAEDQQQAKSAKQRLSLLTPIAKGCMSEWGFEAADQGIQILGGHGYMKEWGIEQRLRDVRITRIYEGTNGIQGMDFLGRKVLADGGEALKLYQEEIFELCNQSLSKGSLKNYAQTLQRKLEEWQQLNGQLLERVMTNPEFICSVAFDYLMYSGYIVLAYQWLRILDAVERCDELSDADCKRKQLTAAFYFNHLLPRTVTHKEIMLNQENVLLDDVEL